MTTTAQDRAEALFQSVLSDDEREELAADGYVTVHGSAGGIYRVYTKWHPHHRAYGRNRNVTRVSNGKAFCTYLPLKYPDFDDVTAKYLLLKYNERHFLQIQGL